MFCRMNSKFYFSNELKERLCSFNWYIFNEMKTLHTRIFCLFMAFQVLFASTGFAVYEHFCKINGVTTLHLFAPTNTCCSVKKASEATKKQSSVKSVKCCSDQITYHKISPNASQGHKIDFQPHSSAYLHTICGVFTHIQVSESKFPNTLLYSNPSPPLSGRDRIIFVQSFLI